MRTRSITRRGMMQLGAAGLVAGTGTSHYHAQVVGAQDAPESPVIVTADGIAGGGVVPTSLGQAQFSLAVFAMDPGDGSTPVVQGSFNVSDQTDPANPVMLESESFNEFSAYANDLPDARQISGWARVNGGGSYPFLLQVEDLGPAGDGSDSFNLVFGDAATPFLGGDAKTCDCAGFSYSLKGVVAGGDIIRFALNGDT